MTSPIFRRQKSAAKWEKGGFTLPNTLVQDKNLTDSGFRLLAWMVSCSADWVVYQSDIMKRFGWGEVKMRAAIDNLIEFKYLIKFPQRKTANGAWAPCDYEWSEHGFTDEEIKEFQIISPYLGDSCTGDSCTSDQGTKQVLNQTNPKKTTTEEPKTAAVFFDQEKPEPERPKVYPCLEPVDIKQRVKEDVTRKFSEADVENAVKYALQPDLIIHRTLTATIIWACGDKPDINDKGQRKEILELIKRIPLEHYEVDWDAKKNLVVTSKLGQKQYNFKRNDIKGLETWLNHMKF